MTHDYDWKNLIPAPDVPRDFMGGRNYYRKDELKALRKKQLAPEQQRKERAQLEVRMEQARMARTEGSTNDE